MLRLALASLRSRASGFIAVFLAVLLGCTIITAFGSLFATAGSDGVSAADQETLVTMASVVGGWGLAIVLFAVASTVGLSVTVTSNAEDPYTAMSTAGPASVLASIGVALLAPALVAGAARVAAGPLRLLGAGGHLAAAQARVRARQQGAVLMPIILFTGIATGTLYLLAIDDAARTASRAVSLTEARTIEALNLVVVGMIAVFAAIMVVNTLVAATLHRRREFGAQRLGGSTPGQVVSMVSAECALLALTGIVPGSLASLATVVPYSMVRLDRVLPDTGVGTYVGIVVVALAVTLGSALGATRIALRTPAVQATS